MSQLINQGGKGITKPEIVDPINDIAWQAHQGSVAAIIQLKSGNQLTKLMQLENFQSLVTAGDDGSLGATEKSLSQPVDDPFAEAVRIANQASARGKIATNSIQWLELAAQWQRASDLMSMVPPEHSRYQEAKIRTQLYKQYSDIAQAEAEKSSF